MERQIRKSSQQITLRNQPQIDKLLERGKTESDPEVKDARGKLNAELKENEAKIRKRIEERIEERINRLRKGAASESNN